jgi:dihydroorotase
MSDSVEEIRIRRPDDWHVHLRDGMMLSQVADYTARDFARAIVMPNLKPPVLTAEDALAYRQRIIEAVPKHRNFTPLMTCYLTDGTTPEMVTEARKTNAFIAAKLYPAHATTNSSHGVTDIRKLSGVFEAMQEAGMPLLIHGEATDHKIDVFDREKVFIDTVLCRLRADFPALRIVLEHVTTADAIAFVNEANDFTAATITPQHLMFNRNAMFTGGIRPHHYCLPVLKREHHRLALRGAATSSSPRFFLGTDSAPHERASKESSCGCAGIFNAAVAIQAYATVFEEEGALDRLEAFCSVNGPSFYGLPLNEERITLRKGKEVVPQLIPLADGGSLVPFLAGETLHWTIVRDEENTEC